MEEIMNLMLLVCMTCKNMLDGDCSDLTQILAITNITIGKLIFPYIAMPENLFKNDFFKYNQTKEFRFPITKPYCCR